MRSLDEKELEAVSGGDWEIGFHSPAVDVTISGDESIQEIAAGIGDIFSDAYWYARDETADLYEWMANGWAYSMSCGRVW